MPPKESVIVNKVPLEYKSVDHPQSFGRYEQLYLELIENKVKIKQNLVNKDYEPPDTLNHLPTMSPEPVDRLRGSPSEDFVMSPSTSESDYKPDEPAEKASKPDRFELPLSEGSESIERFQKLEQQIGSDSERDEQASVADMDRISVASSHHSRRAPEATTNLSNKLQDLLARRGGGDSGAPPTQIGDSRFEEYQRSRKRMPTLSELEKQGATVVRKELADASRLQVEDEDLKREMLFKFDLLRKSYKEQTIPTFTIHSDLGMMTRSYEDTVRRLSLDSSVENYKRYLIGAFMLIEFGLGKWLKFDMKGYTQQQIVSMSSYEKLLIEIGEKSYMPEGEQWSVEIRLVFLVIINTAFFLVGKMIMNNTGANLMNAINSMNRANTEAPPKKKMQGPNINLDDLPDVNEIQ